MSEEDEAARRRVNIIIAELQSKLADLETTGKRREARTYIAELWRAYQGVVDVNAMRIAVLRAALDATKLVKGTRPANIDKRGKSRLSDAAFRLRVARAAIRVSLPEVVVGDDVLGQAVELWPTRQHGKWLAVYALARKLGIIAKDKESLRVLLSMKSTEA